MQWHSAFYAGIQIEFGEEADKLIFEREYNLSTKPMQIDVLIIKKNTDDIIHKNIGKIFRKYNIIEYKSPTDYMSIDDFYKVYGYTYFYKSSAKVADDIKITDLTITFVCKKCPTKLVEHLVKVEGFTIEKKGEGIYYINRDIVPMQLIVTSELSEEENLWLRSMTNDITNINSIDKLSKEYEKHQREELYKSVMNIIIQANKEKFQEVKGMCEALRELFADELDIARNEGIQKGIRTLILSCKELGGTRDVIASMISKNYSVSDEEVEEYMKLYW